VRVRPRTAVGPTPSLKPLQHFNILTDHLGVLIKAAAD